LKDYWIQKESKAWEGVQEPLARQVTHTSSIAGLYCSHCVHKRDTADSTCPSSLVSSDQALNFLFHFLSLCASQMEASGEDDVLEVAEVPGF
jgi:hypothetical protein